MAFHFNIRYYVGFTPIAPYNVLVSHHAVRTGA